MNESLVFMYSLTKVYSWRPRWIEEPHPWVGHMPFARWLIGELRPKIFVELGTHTGNSYFSFCQGVQEKGLKTKCFAVDTWEGDAQAGHYDQRVFSLVQKNNQLNYSKFSTLLKMTFDEASIQFSDRSIDLLHIDGLHTYEAVRHDFEKWLPKLTPGALVLFHDTRVFHGDFGVWKFWKEIVKKHPNHIEMVHSHGLGVVQINPNGESSQKKWLHPTGSVQQVFLKKIMQASAKKIYNELGSREKKGFWRGLEFKIRQKRKIWLAPLGFDPVWYLENYPDVKMSGKNPFLHYREFGLKEGRGKNKKHEVKLKKGRRRNINYTEWIKCNDLLAPTAKAKIKKRINQMHSFPLISVVMPIYNPQPDWLKKAITSVRNQIYPHWQLCLVDDASTNQDVLKILKEEAQQDSRIILSLRAENGNISRASNDALNMASGEWVAFLDHDDKITEDALFWIAHAINQYPEAALIYSDEDKIDESGNRQCPHFKTQINLGLLLSYNYMCHLLAVRKKVVDQVGGFREGLEGAQDYDLILRCMEKIDTSAVVHIPRILYHWRMHPKSTASGVDIKPFAEEAGRRAITEHLQRRGTPGTVSCVPGGYRVDFEITEKPKVSIIIPTHNQELLLNKCVESLLENTDYQNYQIILVDNKTTEPGAMDLLKYYREQGLTVLSYEREFNYSRINNFAVQHAEGELILFMNNDIEVIQKDWLEVMVRQISQPDVGAVGAKLLYPNGRIQHGGVILGVGGVAGHAFKNYPGNTEGYFSRCRLVQDMSAVTAACLLVRKSLFKKINGFDEDYLKVAFNDVDLCLRIKVDGKRIIWTPFTCLMHHESASRGIDKSTCKRFKGEIQYMRRKWDKILDQDPAYNPNLSLEAEDFQLSQIARLPQTWSL